jgi:hypothetical protein
MALLRFFGMFFLAVAFTAIAYDGARMLATPDEGLLLASTRRHLDMILPGAEAQFEEAVRSLGVPLIWEGVVSPLLALPLSLVACALGSALFLLGYRRPPPEIVSE